MEQLFNRKIDLITEDSLSNPYFIKSLEKTKTELYAAWWSKKVSLRYKRRNWSTVGWI